MLYILGSFYTGWFDFLFPPAKKSKCFNFCDWKLAVFSFSFKVKYFRQQKNIDQTFHLICGDRVQAKRSSQKQRCTEKAHWIQQSRDHQTAVCVQYERAWRGVYCECFCVHISISSGCTVSHLLPVFSHLSVLKTMKRVAMDSSGCWSHGRSTDASFPPTTNALLDHLWQVGLFLLFSYLITHSQHKSQIQKSNSHIKKNQINSTLKTRSNADTVCGNDWSYC